MSDKIPARYSPKTLEDIKAELNDLQLTYDSATLAIALVSRGAQIMQMLVTAKIWQPEDAKKVLDEITKVVETDDPIEPKVLYLNGNPSQTKN